MDFFDALVRLETDLWNLVDSELTKRGQVRLALLHALRLLDRLGGNGRVQDLSEGLSITIGAASKLVDRLERDGLAARRRHPKLALEQRQRPRPVVGAVLDVDDAAQVTSPHRDHDHAVAGGSDDRRATVRREHGALSGHRAPTS